MSAQHRGDYYVGRFFLFGFLCFMAWAGWKALVMQWQDSKAEICADSTPVEVSPRVRPLIRTPDDIIRRPYAQQGLTKILHAPVDVPGCFGDRFGGPRVCSHQGDGWSFKSRGY